MPALPALGARLPSRSAVYQHTAFPRRLTWVLIVVPFSVLWACSWILFCILMLVSFGVQNAVRWLSTGEVEELDGSWADHVVQWYTDHGWHMAYHALIDSGKPKPRPIIHAYGNGGMMDDPYRDAHRTGGF
jgi:hypothetical protein